MYNITIKIIVLLILFYIFILVLAFTFQNILIKKQLKRDFIYLYYKLLINKLLIKLLSY